MIVAWMNMSLSRTLAQVPEQFTWLSSWVAEDIEPGWLIFGMCAQVLLAACFVIHLIASRFRHRIVFPRAFGFVCLIATVTLLVYAAHRRELVFVVGQFVNILICLRILALVPSRGDIADEEEGSGFPIVAPGSAERQTPPDND